MKNSKTVKTKIELSWAGVAPQTHENKHRHHKQIIVRIHWKRV